MSIGDCVIGLFICLCKLIMDIFFMNFGEFILFKLLFELFWFVVVDLKDEEDFVVDLLFCFFVIGFLIVFGIIVLLNILDFVDFRVWFWFSVDNMLLLMFLLDIAVVFFRLFFLVE